MTARTDLLDLASKYVSEDRNTSYGDPEDAFTVIADLWSVYLDARPLPHGDVDSYDVSVMMILMKVARLSNRPKNWDSAVDTAGYAACLGEIIQNRNEAVEMSAEDATRLMSEEINKKAAPQVATEWVRPGYDARGPLHTAPPPPPAAPPHAPYTTGPCKTTSCGDCGRTTGEILGE